MVGVVADGDLRVIAEALAVVVELDDVVITAARYDLLAEVVCADHDALLTLLNDVVRAIPGVRAAEAMTYLHLQKQTYTWGTR